MFFEEEFDRAGVFNLFNVRVWSSDHDCIKPSKILFHEAVSRFNLPPDQMVYIWDHPARDVGGAKAAGLASVWIENTERPLMKEHSQPERTISCLADLLKLE